MDIVLIILGSILIIAGIIGCILPVLPGPPLSFAGLLLLHFTSIVHFTTFTIIFTALAALLATILDYFVPAWGTKKAGGTKWGIRGSGIGVIIGLFFAPIGIFVFPFLGALIGELFYHYQIRKNVKDPDKFSKSLVASLGSFLGLIFGIVLKLAVSCFIAFLFIKELILALF